MRIIAQYNDKLAPVYDEATKGEFKWEAPAQVNKALLRRLRKNSKILDLGIGTGQSAEKFYKAGHEITGVDLSEEMLKISKKNLPMAKLIQLDIERGINKLNIGAESFDSVMGVGFLNS